MSTIYFRLGRKCVEIPVASSLKNVSWKRCPNNCDWRNRLDTQANDWQIPLKKNLKVEPKESGKEKRKEREEKTQKIFSFEIVLATQNASSYTRKEFFN